MISLLCLLGRCCFFWWTICSASIRFTCIPWIHSWWFLCEGLIWSVRTKQLEREKEAWCRGSRKQPVKSFKASGSLGTWTFCTRWRRLPKGGKAWTWWTFKVPPPPPPPFIPTCGTFFHLLCFLTPCFLTPCFLTRLFLTPSSQSESKQRKFLDRRTGRSSMHNVERLHHPKRV